MRTCGVDVVRRDWLVAVWLLSGVLAGGARAAAPALLELELADRTVLGKLVALDDDTAWVMHRDGALETLAIGDIRQVTTAAPQFTPLTAAELRDRLRREFRPGFEVAGSEHYLVVAPPGRARQYAEVFENIYRTFYVYFRVRGFQIEPPEFPLVAVVFPDHRGFDEHCRRDGLRAVPGLMGYYLRTSNRVALFDPGDEEISALDPDVRNRERRVSGADRAAGASLLTPPPDRPPVGSFLHPPPPFAACERKGTGTLAEALLHGSQHVGREPVPFLSQALTARHSPAPLARVATITAGLRDTIVHEATHQVAFNTGLHSRIGETPVWIVEGLATVFEAPGIRDPGHDRSITARLNRERFVWFTNFAETRRAKKSLAAFIESDRAFHAATLDGYSQAWALTFYLLETRPGKYARYVQAIAARDPLSPYPPRERLSDFESHFGPNLDLLETDFLRYMARLRNDR